MKFIRGQEPKEAMGIGFFSPKSFKNHDEARKWVMQNHTTILERDGLCFPYPTPEEFAKIHDFVIKYIKEPLSSSDQYGWDVAYMVDGVGCLYHELNEIRNVRFPKNS